jgi:hypothetical protein
MLKVLHSQSVLNARRCCQIIYFCVFDKQKLEILPNNNFTCFLFERETWSVILAEQFYSVALHKMAEYNKKTEK